MFIIMHLYKKQAEEEIMMKIVDFVVGNILGREEYSGASFYFVVFDALVLTELIVSFQYLKHDGILYIPQIQLHNGMAIGTVDIHSLGLVFDDDQ